MSEMLINHLPAPTWNWLKVNDVNVKLPDDMSSYDAEFKSDEVTAKKSSETLLHKEEEFGALRSGMGDAFSAYIKNAASNKSYLVIDKKLDKPVYYSVDLSACVNGAAGARIELAEGASATVVMTYEGKNDSANRTAGIDTRIFVGKNASLKLVQLFLSGTETVLYNDVAAEVADKGSFDIVHIILSGRKNYSGCSVRLLGDKAKTRMDIAYVAGEGNTIDCNYIAEHFGKKTNSEIMVSGVMEAHSEKVFRGTIDFKRGSAESVGEEKEDVLLLDEDVVNKTVPLILCQEEDVEGSHGATIGKLSDDILFYLGARGIEEALANKLIANGRIASVARKIGDPDTEKKLLALVGVLDDEDAEADQ